MTSRLIAGPGGEPVSLAEAKAWCRIDGDDEDALVTALIAAARLEVESLTDRALLTQTWRLILAVPAGARIALPVRPLAGIVRLSLNGEPVAEPVTDGDALCLAPEQGGALVLDYRAGYGAADDVPADLKQAVLLLVAYWYQNRDAVAQSLPVGLDRLLAPYRAVRL